MAKRETVGDPNRLDCPACGKPGLNDLWDGSLNGMHDGDTNEVQCGYCERMIPIVLYVTAEVRATWEEQEVAGG